MICFLYKIHWDYQGEDRDILFAAFHRVTDDEEELRLLTSIFYLYGCEFFSKGLSIPREQLIEDLTDSGLLHLEQKITTELLQAYHVLKQTFVPIQGFGN